MSNCGEALEYASSELRADHEIVRLAVSQSRKAVKYALIDWPPPPASHSSTGATGGAPSKNASSFDSNGKHANEAGNTNVMEMEEEKTNGATDENLLVAGKEGVSSKSSLTKPKGSRKTRPPLVRMSNGLSSSSEDGKRSESNDTGGSGSSGGSNIKSSSHDDNSKKSSSSSSRHNSESRVVGMANNSALDAPPRLLKDGRRSGSNCNSSSRSSSISCYGGGGRSTVSFLSFSSTAHKLAPSETNNKYETVDLKSADGNKPPPPKRSPSSSLSRTVTPARSSITSTSSRTSKFPRSPSTDDASVAAAAEGVMIIKKQRVKVFTSNASDSDVLAWCVADQSLGLKRKANTEVNRVTCEDNASVTESAMAAVCTRCPFVVALDFGNCSNLNGDLALLQVRCASSIRFCQLFAKT